MGTYLPELAEQQNSVEMIGEFLGYNHNPRISDGEFWDMGNLSPSDYPTMCQRPRRGKIAQLEKPNGLFAHSKLCWVDGTEFYYDGEYKGELEDNPKSFVSMGARVVIWPDKMMYNAEDDTLTSLENEVSMANVAVKLCKMDGTTYTGVSSSLPSNPSNGDLYLDTKSDPHVLKQYSSSSGTWVSVPTTYLRLEAQGIGNGFNAYDGITIAGFSEDACNGDFVIYAVESDYIVIVGIIDKTYTEKGTITISRTVPDMDYITELDNRLWGCSSSAHEIYACKLGDPTNWRCYMGISTDSYAATVGSQGDFTGAASHGGYVLFFKDDGIHKLYGSKPSNYQLSFTSCRGVEKGSEKSIAMSNETLFYKSHWDICAYGSALPQSISQPLGQQSYHNAVGGALSNEYYVSMEDASGTPWLFCYNTQRGLWYKIDSTRAVAFARLGE